MTPTEQRWLPMSALALCGAVVWGVLEALALLRSRWAVRRRPGA